MPKPRTKAASVKKEAKPKTAVRTRGRSTTKVAAPPPVILAMSDVSLSRMVTFALDQMRLSHVHFQSGSETLAGLLQMQPDKQPPVLVLDVDLPGMDGHAILERLAVDQAGSFLIIVLSSHADESMQVRSLSAGAVDHIAKPFNVRVLMAKIQRLVSLSMRVSRMPRRRATDRLPASG